MSNKVETSEVKQEKHATFYNIMFALKTLSPQERSQVIQKLYETYCGTCGNKITSGICACGVRNFPVVVVVK